MALKRAATTSTQETQAQAEKQQAQETVNEQVLETREEQAQAEADNAAAAGAQFDDDAQQDAEHEQEALQGEVEQAETTSVNAEQVSSEAKEPSVNAEQVQHKEVAVAQQQGTAVATQHAGEVQRGAISQYVADMASLGFEGLTVDGMSFDRIKLTEGQFVLGTEEVKLGDSFDFQLMSTRPIYIVRQYDDDNAEIYFSYDEKGMTLTDGSSAAEIREKWLEDGYGTADQPLDIKRYLEGMAQLINRDDEWEGHMVSLSIPPASTSRLGGALITGKQRFKLDATGLALTAKVGNKITKGSISWRPWVFLAKGPLAA